MPLNVDRGMPANIDPFSLINGAPRYIYGTITYKDIYGLDRWTTFRPFGHHSGTYYLVTDQVGNDGN